MPAPASDPSFQSLADGTLLLVRAPDPKKGIAFSQQTPSGSVLASGALRRGILTTRGELSTDALKGIYAAAKGTDHAPAK